MTNDIVDILDALIGVPTTHNHPVTGIASLLASRAEDAGAHVESIESSPGKQNVIARFGPKGTDGLVISGHMDVVPTDGQPWTSDPYALTERDGILYGRGTADMKGFIATITALLPQLPVADFKRELVLIWTHDEEIGCVGSGKLATAYTDPLPSQAWIGEPTGFLPCRMHPGHTTVSIRCTGRAAHSSKPGLGFNAIHVASRVVAQLETLASTWRSQNRFSEHLESPFTVMNIGQIHGGTAVNIVPDQCTIRVGLRPLPGDQAIERVAEITDCLNAVRQHARFGGGEIAIDVDQIAPALLTPSGTALERALCAHSPHSEATGVPFATDGGNFQEMGIASLVFGPGAIDVAHKADEHIDPKELVQCGRVAADLIHRFCVTSASGA